MPNFKIIINNLKDTKRCRRQEGKDLSDADGGEHSGIGGFVGNLRNEPRWGSSSFAES